MNYYCPECKSKNVTIDRWFDCKTRGDKYKFKCRDCGFESHRIPKTIRLMED